MTTFADPVSVVLLLNTCAGNIAKLLVGEVVLSRPSVDSPAQIPH